MVLGGPSTRARRCDRVTARTRGTVHDRAVKSSGRREGYSGPAILYYYTDAAGLTGILNPSRWPDDVESPSGGAALLWATDIRYMNDSREMRHGAELLSDRLRAEARTGEDDMAKVFDLAAGQLDVGVFNTRAKHLRVFATCFCAKGDLLSQWRGYAGGLGGYAIGFRSDVLREQATALSTSSGLGRFGFSPAVVPVIYGKRAARPVLDSVVADLRRAWKSGWLTETNDGESLQLVSALVYGAVGRLKDKAFREEREFRLFTFLEQGQPVAVRPRGDKLLPYVEIGVNLPEDGVQARHPVAKVVVGPSPDQEGQVSVVRDLLQIGGFPDVDVRRSKVPYRG